MQKHIIYHDVLGDCFGFTRHEMARLLPALRMFPGDNDQAVLACSKRELSEYQVFFGNFSISSLDFLQDAVRVTVLVDPVLRILNKYAQLREAGRRLNDQSVRLAADDFRMLAAQLPIEQFLSFEEERVAQMINSTFDNFYTYYFGTRYANGRALIRDVYSSGDYFISYRVVDNAIQNLEAGFAVYQPSTVELMLKHLADRTGAAPQLGELPRISANLGHDAIEAFIAQNASNVDRAKEVLHLSCELDHGIYAYFL